MPIDETKLEQAVSQVFADLGVAASAPIVALGDRLGLWAAMAGAGPLTPAELAARTDLVERYVREWLCAVAISRYVDYDPAGETFELSDEMAAVLATDDTPTALIGVFGGCEALWADLDRVATYFHTGAGMGWGDHHESLNAAQARFTRPAYRSAFADAWVAALDGVHERLTAGGRVADIGCGHGVSTIVLAEAFPNSTIAGFDIDPQSIAVARKAAAEAGVADRVTFEVADAAEIPGGGYDLVSFTDCLHDLGDPVAAAAHARTTLAPHGTLLVVEPNAADRLEDDFTNPYARIGYSVSTLVCTPSSLGQPGRRALGTMAGEKRLRQVLTDAGYGLVRRVAQETAPFNIILEAKP